MSVTFSIEAVSTGNFSATCYDAETPLVTGVTYDAANAAIAAHQEKCDTCACYRPFARAEMDVDDMEVNMHNSGATRVLEVLGLGIEATDDPFGGGQDLCGSEDGTAFLGRVLVALAVAPYDEGRPAMEQPRNGGARVVIAERPAGDLQERLERLLPVAQEAARLGRCVTWG
jgi:hypothetical protein